jgi:DNA-binding response OmpR family regulator
VQPTDHVTVRRKPTRRRRPGSGRVLVRPTALAGEPRTTPKHEAAPAATAPPRRVLVVEDEPSMRFLCRLNLELGGFEVVEAETGAEALARARDVDLVLLDVMLPDIGGHEIGRRLVEQSGPPFAFISARAGHDDLRAGYELGAADYITKPFDPSVLPARVDEILERVERGEADRFRAARLAELEG